MKNIAIAATFALMVSRWPAMRSPRRTTTACTPDPQGMSGMMHDMMPKPSDPPSVKAQKEAHMR